MKKRRGLDLALVMCPSWGVVHPPVGISYLKGFLEKHHVDVKCFDLSLELYKVFPEKKYWDLNCPDYFITPQLFDRDILPTLKPFIKIWAEQILGYNPEVVGFSLFMSNIIASILLAQYLKKIKPDLKIVGGGADVARIKKILVDEIKGFAPLNKEAIRNNIFDVLVENEGEETLLEILSLAKQRHDFYSVKGSLFIKNDKLIVNRSRELIDDLDILPSPDFSDFELSSYTRKTLPIVTSRGCINRCTFCSDSPLWKIYRCQSAEKVVKEINFLIKRYRKNQFEIQDSTFNGDIRRVDRICYLIIRSKLDIEWSAKVILRKEMSCELLKEMKKAGCCSLAYGVESGSPSVLNDMRKNINLNEAKRIIRDTWKAGIEANCFFIIGYPTETEEDFQKTLNFIKENAKFIFRFDQITGCHIEQNSYLGLNLDKYGIIFKEDGWYSKESTPKVRQERLERFREFARKLHKHYQCEVQL